MKAQISSNKSEVGIAIPSEKNCDNDFIDVVVKFKGSKKVTLQNSLVVIAWGVSAAEVSQ